MDVKKKWLSALKKQFGKSPLKTTLGFTFIQMILEKLVDTQFSCPCHSGYNSLYTSVCFFVPPIIVFSLMFVIRCKCKCMSFCEALASSVISAGIWLVIVFIDGRYYACAKTSWTGKYEMIEKAESQQWCKPTNSSQELLAQTQLWYSESQVIGFCTAALLAVICLPFFISYLHSSCCKENEEEIEEMGQNEAVSSL